VTRLRAVEAEFPGWHAWRSNAGRWWATRTGPDEQRERPVPRTVDADDEAGLRALLAELAELRASLLAAS
jgi:hypothetical protein